MKNTSKLSDANIDIDVVVYGGVLDDTARHDLSLKMISQLKSNSKIGKVLFTHDN